MLTDITYHQDMKLQIQESCQLFELSYCVSGEIHCDWNSKNSHTLSQTGNVLFLEDVRVCEEKKAGIRNQLLEVRFTPDELLCYAEDVKEQRKWRLGSSISAETLTSIRTRLRFKDAYRK